MTLTEITQAANAYTDENFPATMVKYFVNEAVSKINAELKTQLPTFIDLATNYTALSDDWQRNLLVPYASYSIKMNDGSLNEADRYYSIFAERLATLKNEKSSYIGEQYRAEDFDGIYQYDLRQGINRGWFGDR